MSVGTRLPGRFLEMAIPESRCKRTRRTRTHKGSVSDRARVGRQRCGRSVRCRTARDHCVRSDAARRRLPAPETAMEESSVAFDSARCIGPCRGIEGMARRPPCSGTCQRKATIRAGSSGCSAPSRGGQGVSSDRRAIKGCRAAAPGILRTTSGSPPNAR